MACQEEHIVCQFIDAINGHNCDSLFSLFDSDFRFMDQQGKIIKRNDVLLTWMSCLNTYNGSKLDINMTMFNGCYVGLFGRIGKLIGKRYDYRPMSILVKVQKGLIK